MKNGYDVTKILSRAYGSPVWMTLSTLDKREEYHYALFFKREDWLDYVERGNDQEDMIVWQNDKGGWSFSTLVHDAGVRYHRDGSGTPPSSEFVDHGKIYWSEEAVFMAVIKQFAEYRIAEIQESLREMEVDLMDALLSE